MSPQSLTTEEQEKLFKLALTAKETSYSPYSKFRVGACLITKDGHYFQGCNIENASYGGAICAERTAMVKAVSEGYKDFKALAVSTDQDANISPCGICRQFIAEFCAKDMPIYLLNTHGESKNTTTEELLPFAFTKDDM